MVELWELMEIPVDERKDFSHVSRLISSSVDEVTKQGCLSLNTIEQVKLLTVLNLPCNFSLGENSWYDFSLLIICFFSYFLG